VRYDAAARIAGCPCRTVHCNRPTPARRLLVEAFGTAAVIAAVWAAWVLLWMIEQRW
jgi:hypothetical protein